MPIRVLLAEDHPVMRQAIIRLLTKHCIVVKAVACGEDAMAAINEESLDAIILDVALPGLNGLQVLAKLRPLFPQLAVILLSSHDPVLYGKEALERGADSFVSKSDAARQLWPSLEAAVLRRRKSRTGQFYLGRNA